MLTQHDREIVSNFVFVFMRLELRKLESQLRSVECHCSNMCKIAPNSNSLTFSKLDSK